MKRETGMALKAVEVERNRQDAKWGRQRHSFPVWVAVLMEEVGEFAQAVLKGREAAYEVTDDFEGPQMLECLLDQRYEAVQCAAVAVAIVEHLDELIVVAEQREAQEADHA